MLALAQDTLQALLTENGMEFGDFYTIFWMKCGDLNAYYATFSTKQNSRRSMLTLTHYTLQSLPLKIQEEVWRL